MSHFGHPTQFAPAPMALPSIVAIVCLLVVLGMTLTPLPAEARPSGTVTLHALSNIATRNTSATVKPRYTKSGQVRVIKATISTKLHGRTTTKASLKLPAGTYTLKSVVKYKTKQHGKWKTTTTKWMTQRGFTVSHTSTGKSSASRAVKNPAYNVPIPTGFITSCITKTKPSKACLKRAISAYTKAHATEKLPPLRLPAHFATWSHAKQDLTLINIERTIRGLAPVAGVNRTLNKYALTGAKKHTEPTLGKYSASFAYASGSNWAGTGNVLLANYLYLYADGRNRDGSQPTNIACPSRCWGHRQNILWNRSGATTVLGSAAASKSNSTQLFFHTYSSKRPFAANYLSWSAVKPSVPKQTK